MRVISGQLGGRSFDSPHGKRTHPMSDKVRGALFNILGDIDGLTVLDAFAGSGALSYEAISRGANSVLAVEIDSKAQKTIAKNIQDLALAPQIKLVRANCSSWSETNPGQQFELVLADPPFDDLQLSVVQKLSTHVQLNGLLALNWPGSLSAPTIVNLKLVDQKNYGDTQLLFYKTAN